MWCLDVSRTRPSLLGETKFFRFVAGPVYAKFGLSAGNRSIRTSLLWTTASYLVPVRVCGVILADVLSYICIIATHLNYAETLATGVPKRPRKLFLVPTLPK